MHNLLRDDVYQSDMRAIASREIKHGLFAPMCGTFSVSRFRPDPRVRVVRTDEALHGVPGCTPAEMAQVRTSDIITERCCYACRALHDNGGHFIFENPVRRNDPNGPWKRFNSGKFPRHGSIWQMPCVNALANSTGARILHFPMCWFEHCDRDVCNAPQKFLTYMYSKELEPALGFMRDMDCFHARHAAIAVGIDDSGTSQGAATSTYYAEQNRIVVRAFVAPDRCASDASWLSAIASLSSPHPPTASPSHVLLPVVDDAVDAKGLPGDRATATDGAKLARGHQIDMRRITTRQVHEAFAHKPVDVLRGLADVCSDVPEEWRQLKDLADPCADCLAGNHKHFGSHSHLPETSEPGEIVCYDLLILRTPDRFTGGVIMFVAIDLFSDWDMVKKIKYKTEVPECVRELHRVAKSYGLTIRRCHTDGENIFHSEEAHDAMKDECAAFGCLLTTGSDYDHRQNSKAERHIRRLGDLARPGFCRSLLGDDLYQCALVDASTKHKVLPLARRPEFSPMMLFTGSKGKALPLRAFGQLAFVRLEHELNASAVPLNKSHARAEPGILLSYGSVGTLHDRYKPGWAVFVPTWNQRRPFITPHCTVVLDCFPGVEGLRKGLINVLRDSSDDSGGQTVSLSASDEGDVAASTDPVAVPAPPPVDRTLADAVPPSPVTAEREPAPTVASPTIAQRLRRDVSGQAHGDTAHVRNPVGGIDFDAALMCDDIVLALDDCQSAPRARTTLPAGGFHPTVSLGAPEIPVPPSLQTAPWLSTPRGGGDDNAVLVADLSGVYEPMESQLYDCANHTPSADLLASVTRTISTEAPRRVVRFPWGDVPTPWVQGYSTVYDTGIDDSVFVLEDCVLTSLTEEDDPHWSQAIRGNDSKEWYAAADGEYDNLERFGVFELWPADKVPLDEDIFDTMLLCKLKRGADNQALKRKIRCVLCGNQMIESAKRGESKTCADMRTHSPACRASSLKCNFAVGVLHHLRQLDFDVDAAYLQGQYVDRRVFCRPPQYFRKYDERGVEYVWLLRRPLYGGSDSGRLWYNTFAEHLMNEPITPMQRCHYEPAGFVHVCDMPVVVSETKTTVTLAPPSETKRILLLAYVDDGRTWDNCAEVCDAFYVRLEQRFSITRGTGSDRQFMLGMDIQLGEGWVKIYSATYILGMCQKWLEHPIVEYDQLYSPSHPKLMDHFEAALLLRGNTPPSLGFEYRSLVGGLLFPCPMTRPDCLFTAGIHARAMDFATRDLFQTALHWLVFMGQTAKDGITYSANAPNASQLVYWSDSDWSTRRSTTGGTGQLAGGSVIAASRRQDCVTGSSTHAEVVAASSNSNDVVWTRGYLEEIGLPQLEPTPFMVDAQNVITLAHNLISSKQTRHITRRELIVRERDTDGTLEVRKVHTSENLADMLTKALDREPFTVLRRSLLNLLVRAATVVAPRLRRRAAASV